MPSWEQAKGRTYKQAKKRVTQQCLKEVEACFNKIGLGSESLHAVIQHVQWSAAAEHRLLASFGVRVRQIDLDDLEPFLGRGRMPVLKDMRLQEVLGMVKSTHERQSRMGSQVR